MHFPKECILPKANNHFANKSLQKKNKEIESKEKCVQEAQQKCDWVKNIHRNANVDEKCRVNEAKVQS